MSFVAEQLESEYASSGLTAERVSCLMHSLADGLPGQTLTSIEDVSTVLYVNSSDPFGVLARTVDLAGRNVLTVAGCGDLPLLFVSKGCASIRVMDLSPFALFLTELKFLAVEQLSLIEYLRLFKLPEINDNTYCGPFFDEAGYESLRAWLSPPARTYFDLLRQPHYRMLATVNARDADNSRLVRHRLCYHPAAQQRIDAFLTENTYDLLKERLCHTVLRVGLADIRELAASSRYEYVYLSNIGHLGDYQGKLAQAFLSGGSNTVGLTLRRRRSLPRVLDEQGRAYPSMREVPSGSFATNIFLNLVQLSRGDGACVREEPVLPGRGVTLGPVTAMVVGVSIGDDFPVYAEVRADAAEKHREAG